jgi:hypothetical protein
MRSITVTVLLGPFVALLAAQAETDSAAIAGASGSDIVHVAPPTGEVGADRASIVVALEQARPGDTIQFAPGTYLVGELIPIATPDLTVLGHVEGTTLRGCDPARLETLEAELVQAMTSGDPAGAAATVRSCGMFELTGGHTTVRNLVFEYTRLGLMLGCCQLEGIIRPDPGGYRIEDNTFRNSANGVRPGLSAPEPTIIRGNRFINVFHAVSAAASHLHVLDNVITAPEPEQVPALGHPSFAIAIGASRGPADTLALAIDLCEHNVISGNRIEGHPDGILIIATPGTSCRNNVIRSNTIVVRRVPLPAVRPVPNVPEITDDTDSTIVGVPLALENLPPMPGQTGDPAEQGVFEENLIEGNQLIGAHGLGMIVHRASRNRIVNNTITGIARRDPFPGNTLAFPPVRWREANGSGIWISRGSDRNEIHGNTFEDIASYAVVLEGDGNVVETRSASDTVRDLGSGNRVTESRRRIWFARPGADGDGTTPAHPFGSTAAIEDASEPGDMIVLLPGDVPFDGGLTLKPGQILVGQPEAHTLPVITNTSAERNGGNGIVLADSVRILNLRVAETQASGIYGADVTGVTISRVDVVGANRAPSQTSTTLQLFETLCCEVPVPVSACAPLPHGGIVLLSSRPASASTASIIESAVLDAAGIGIAAVAWGGARYRLLVADTRIEGGTEVGGHDYGVMGMAEGTSSEVDLRLTNVRVAGRTNRSGRNVIVYASAGAAASASMDRSYVGESGQDGVIAVAGLLPATATLDIRGSIIENAAQTNVEGTLLALPPIDAARAGESRISIDIASSTIRGAGHVPGFEQSASNILLIGSRLTREPQPLPNGHYSLTVRNSRIESAGRFGIRLGSSGSALEAADSSAFDVLLRDNTIVENGAAELSIGAPNVRIDARLNCWGDRGGASVPRIVRTEVAATTRIDTSEPVTCESLRGAPGRGR